MEDKNNLVVDFTLLNNKRRKYLFFKRPKGNPVPVGITWRCLCGMDNVLSEAEVQYCCSCGSCLKLQENKEEHSKYYSLVIVCHINSGPR